VTFGARSDCIRRLRGLVGDWSTREPTEPERLERSETRSLVLSSDMALWRKRLDVCEVSGEHAGPRKGVFPPRPKRAATALGVAARRHTCAARDDGGPGKSPAREGASQGRGRPWPWRDGPGEGM
jgi:hypothetical protein